MSNLCLAELSTIMHILYYCSFALRFLQTPSGVLELASSSYTNGTSLVMLTLENNFCWYDIRTKIHMQKKQTKTTTKKKQSHAAPLVQGV